MLISLSTEQKRGKGSPALLPGGPFEEGDALGTARPGSGSPGCRARAAATAESLPEAGGSEPSGPGSLPRADLAEVSGAACAAAATQRYRVAATSGHTCTANS